MSADPGITQLYMHPRQAVRLLVEAGVVRGLDDAALDRLREECWDGSEEQLEDAGLLGILTFHYESSDKGARDGFVWHSSEFWKDTDDAVAELAACLRPSSPPLFRQISARERVSIARKFREKVLAMVLERDDGVRKDVEARNLGDVVEAFNAELEVRGSTRRFFRLDTGGDDWLMFACLERGLARKLVAEGALPVVDLDALTE